MSQLPLDKNPGLLILLLAVLIKRAGGSVTITQEEIDSVAFGQLHEYSLPEANAIELQLVDRTKQ